MNRKAYPSDVCDEEWAFVAAYLTQMTEAASQGEYARRGVFNRGLALDRTGASWPLRVMRTTLSLWAVVYQQTNAG
jgi:transposase